MPEAAARHFDGVPSRDRRGMVPDMCVALPAPGGGGAVAEVDCLAELKFIHFGPSQYPDAALRHPAPCRAVAGRAERVHGEYVRKARALDQQSSEAPGAITREQFREVLDAYAVDWRNDTFLNRVFDGVDVSGSYTVQWRECLAGMSALLKTGSAIDRLELSFSLVLDIRRATAENQPQAP